MPARRTLYWKYAAYFTGLVSALLVLSGVVGGYFAYRESMSALEAVQRANAQFTAVAIGNFMQGALNAVQASVGKFNTTGEVGAEDLRIELIMLLRHHPEISELRWIAPGGEERVSLSRVELNVENSRRDWSDDPRFRGARSASRYVSQVYFRKGTEPFVSVAAARGSDSSVLEAEVNLKFIWDVVSQVPMAATDVVYVVDRSGQLISHTDMGLVLGKTDPSILPHVRRILDQKEPTIIVIGKATDIRGLPVISTAAPIPNLGWTVFAEQSVETALRPVYASMARSTILVLIGIAVAFVASLLSCAPHGSADPRNRSACRRSGRGAVCAPDCRSYRRRTRGAGHSVQPDGRSPAGNPRHAGSAHRRENAGALPRQRGQDTLSRCGEPRPQAADPCPGIVRRTAARRHSTGRWGVAAGQGRAVGRGAHGVARDTPRPVQARRRRRQCRA